MDLRYEAPPERIQARQRRADGLLIASFAFLTVAAIGQLASWPAVLYWTAYGNWVILLWASMDVREHYRRALHDWQLHRAFDGGYGAGRAYTLQALGLGTEDVNP